MVVGQPIAVVAAETERQAREAAKAVVVEYEDLTPVMDIEDAIAGEPRVWSPGGCGAVWCGVVWRQVYEVEGARAGGGERCLLFLGEEVHSLAGPGQPSPPIPQQPHCPAHSSAP